MLYHKNNKLNIPKAMTSFGADGGMVSVSAICLFLLRHFHGQAVLIRLYTNCKNGTDLPPMRAGWHSSVQASRIFDPTGAIPYFMDILDFQALWHSTSKRKIYIAGTVNQTAHPGISFRTMISLTQRILKR